jgi:hypothetical protein
MEAKSSSFEYVIKVHIQKKTLYRMNVISRSDLLNLISHMIICVCLSLFLLFLVGTNAKIMDECAFYKSNW